MKFVGFEIENFKGITKTSLDFSKVPHSNIFTLVGLNESGKTTILEAINSFSPDKEGVESLYRDIFKRVHPQDLVPKTKKGIFSGSIVVRALVAIDEEDKKKIEEFCKTKFKAEIDLSKIADKVQVEREHTFKNSTFQETNVIWDVDVVLRKKGKQSKFKNYDQDTPEWQAVTDLMGEMFPKVCYFPTFLFGFPEKIYLSNPPKESKDATVNAYYVQIIQDILDSIGGNLNIKTHILDKVDRTAQPDGLWNWFGFLKTDEKQQIDHVMLLIANKVSDVVINRWDEVFGVKLQNKSIDIEWAVEAPANNSSQRSVYLTFRIKDGQGQYNLAERSLGFRWFFCFLLFTQFRAFRKNDSAIFLFDEPASNLHSKAQEQLLKSFSAISKGNNAIIYSTHSPYMIEPRWLEGAFIVTNDAIDFEKDPSEENRRGTDTNIHVKKYREFVYKNPGKVTYFQPILDKLDYAPSRLELGLQAVFVEGKNDFYMLSYFKDIVFGNEHTFAIVPSSGANDLGPLISLYLGWGKAFLVLLDDDKAGREAAEKYKQGWRLSDQVHTISFAEPSLKGKAIEKILSKDGLALIANELGKSAVTKKEIGRFFQEKFAQAAKFKFDTETINSAKTILDSCGKKFP